MIIVVNISIYKIYAQAPEIWKRYTGEIADPNIPVLPDYSYAGYLRGEQAIPAGFNYQVFDVTDPVYGAIPDDENSDQVAIQAAIDAAEANGSGIVYFPSGEYLVNTDPNDTSPITINSSNVILKGSGSIPGGTIINMKNYMRLPSGVSTWNNSPMFVFKPINTPTIESTEITNNSQRGDNFVYVDNPDLFLNQKYCRLVMNANTDANTTYLDGKTPRSVWTSIINNGVALQEIHEIESIDITNKKVYFKDPVIDNINASNNWKAQTFTLLEHCGFEDIHFKANFTDAFVHHKDYIHDYGWKAVKMSSVAHSWVRRSRFTNVSNSVKITASSYASSLLNNLVDGNGGHALSIVDGGSTRILQGLIWDNTSPGQWHGADMSGKTCGSVVWRIEAPKKYGMDLHGSMPRTNLIDLYTMAWVSGAGGSYVNLPNHLTGLTMWNVKRTGTSSTTVNLWNDCGSNYCGLAIVNPIIVGYHGNASTTFNQAHVKYEESNGTKVNIESLYEAQLEYRLGAKPAWVDTVLDEWNILIDDWYATNTLEYQPRGDAHVRSGTYGDTNYGGSNNLEVKHDGGSYERRVFLSFDLSGLQNVSSAKLRLTPNTYGNTDYNVKYVSDDTWDESTINWNNKPNATTLLDTQPGGSGPIEWDITNQVQSEINGDGILSLELTGVSLGVYGNFYSKEYGDKASRPTLIVDLADDEIGAMEDAYVRSGSHANNTYNNTNLEVKNDVEGYARQTYLKFDLSSIDRKIISAKLQLVPKLGTDPDNGVIHDVKFVSNDNWSETSITWNNKPSASTLLDSQTVQKTGTAISWDVTVQAESERLGDGYLSIQLSSNSNTYINYGSRESGGNKPKLILKFASANVDAPTLEVVQPTHTEATGSIQVISAIENLSFSLNGVTFDNTTGFFENLESGNYTVYAKNADGQVSLGSNAVINPQPVAPSVLISLPSDNESFYAPAKITIIAEASDADGTVTKVEFFNGNTKIGEDLTAPYSLEWENVQAGNYTITAKATDNDGASTISEVVHIIVECPEVQLIIPNVYAMDPSVDLKNTLYIGYGPSSLTLTALVLDNQNFSYSWNTGDQTTSIEVSEAGTYTVTVTYGGGCQASASINISVLDVSCGNSTDKVQLCHNGKIICVASSAVQSHLDHGDRLGSCLSDETNDSEVASAVVYPNPLQDYLYVSASELVANAKISLYNFYGNRINEVAFTTVPQKMYVGDLIMGTYFIVIQNGNQISQYTVIKK
ncbi:hypothetical protein GCM10022395_21130 [Snuella lapsa]|uniref:PKD/Chitinase domain-containing protein n=1 Tax=Snuella lapsa TaxID=870481 RepID=A0ABP6XRB7_9FLAO